MTERTELHATGWRDCTYASGMMAVWFGRQGASIFPLGFTAEEREALERSDDKPDEQGANINTDLILACQRRYGVTLRQQAGSLRAALAAAGPDAFFVFAGSNGRWPAGDHFRRWDPGFAGNHATAGQGTGDGKTIWWMDPEAPATYAGEPIDIDHLMTWSFGDGWARVVTAGEFRQQEAPEVKNLTKIIRQRFTANGANGVLRADADRSLVPSSRLAAGTEFVSVGEYVTADGYSWRVGEWPKGSGKVAWMLRYAPDIPADHDFIAREFIDPDADFAAGVQAAARLAATAKR